MEGWEYKVDRHSIEVSHASTSLEQIQECLNTEGSDGWEVVSIMETDARDDVLDFIVVYKRPAELRPPAITASPEQMNEFVDKAKELLEKKRDGL